jgi:hypothetical protein
VKTAIRREVIEELKCYLTGAGSADKEPAIAYGVTLEVHVSLDVSDVEPSVSVTQARLAFGTTLAGDDFEVTLYRGTDVWNMLSKEQRSGIEDKMLHALTN